MGLRLLRSGPASTALCPEGKALCPEGKECPEDKAGGIDVHFLKEHVAEAIHETTKYCFVDVLSIFIGLYLREEFSKWLATATLFKSTTLTRSRTGCKRCFVLFQT